MSNRVLQQKSSYSQKYQRELGLSVVFQYMYYGRFFLPLNLANYFIDVLNSIILNYHEYNRKVWEIVYRSNFFVMNYMERALLLMLYAEIKSGQIPTPLLVFIYIRLAKKYCRKNFHKLIPVFVSHAEKNF